MTDPDGLLVPGVHGITLQTFARQGVWAVSGPGDVIPGAMKAVYDVVILMDRGVSQSTLKTQGSLMMYAVAQDSVVAGEVTSYYRILGMVDLTAGKASEITSWGVAKGLFR